MDSHENTRDRRGRLTPDAILARFESRRMTRLDADRFANVRGVSEGDAIRERIGAAVAFG